MNGSQSLGNFPEDTDVKSEQTFSTLSMTLGIPGTRH